MNLFADFNQIFLDVIDITGYNAELIRFWRPLPNFEGHVWTQAEKNWHASYLGLVGQNLSLGFPIK